MSVTLRGRIVAALLAVPLGVAGATWLGSTHAAALGVSISGAMEGTRYVIPWTEVRAGFAVSLPAGHPAATVTVSAATVSIPVRCGDEGQGFDSVTVPMGTQSYQVAGGDTSWVPTAGTWDRAAWQGSVLAGRDFCGGNGGWADAGASFTATVSTSDPAHSVAVRFHYSIVFSPGVWSAAVTMPATYVPPPPPPTPAPTPVPTAAPTPGGTGSGGGTPTPGGTGAGGSTPIPGPSGGGGSTPTPTPTAGAGGSGTVTPPGGGSSGGGGATPAPSGGGAGTSTPRPSGGGGSGTGNAPAPGSGGTGTAPGPSGGSNGNTAPIETTGAGAAMTTGTGGGNTPAVGVAGSTSSSAGGVQSSGDSGAAAGSPHGAVQGASVGAGSVVPGLLNTAVTPLRTVIDAVRPVGGAALPVLLALAGLAIAIVRWRRRHATQSGQGGAGPEA
jgi:hypothetical protein